MGQAIKSICELVNNAVLHSWSATARLVVVLAVIAALVLVAATVAPWRGWW